VVRLIELLKRHEGKTLEFKRDLSSPEGILKTLVAFANTAGGTVVIGVEDGSKNVRGVPDVLASEEKLANLVSDSIRPRLIPDTDVVPWRNLNVFAGSTPATRARTTWNGWDPMPEFSSAWARPIEGLRHCRSKS
jgi:predicted HTH transcriptional regulator